ncbi:MAG TPA: hypothetical protein PLR39_08820 [Treponemataceae bacterium]|mgnify:FL=1|nr:hypothetical protein [Spirochaetaceae bacterium]HOS30900.1 hypothetical protein [Treponemataceae bacterium]
MKKRTIERGKVKENEQEILFTFDEILHKMRKSYPPVVENQDAIMWRFKERTRKDMNIIAKYAKEEGKREAARNMKKEGLRIELIARCTTLPLEDIAVL